MHEEQLTPSEGPSPTDVDADDGEAMEDLISGMDRYAGAEEHTTLAEQHDGDTIDERNRREQLAARREAAGVDLVDEADDGVDREKDLVGDSERSDGPVPAELAAMHVVDDAPGVVDHPDDYVEPDTR
jgi:flavin-dependent dehydrogenase